MSEPTQVFRELEQILRIHGVEPRGVIHVGAHSGQEYEIYEELFEHITLVEPQPYYATLLRESIGERTGVTIVEAAVADSDSRRARLAVLPFDQQSSLLQHVATPATDTIWVDVVPLHEIQTPNHNVLVIDAQGAEQSIIESGTLSQFDLIVVECCTMRRYHDAPIADEVRKTLFGLGWDYAEEYPHDGDRTVVDYVFVPVESRRGAGGAIYYDRERDALRVETSPADEIEEIGAVGSDLYALVDAPSGQTVGFLVEHASKKYAAEVLAALPSS